MSTVDARAFSAAQDFLLGAKKFWTTQMYPLLREQDSAHVAHAATPVDARMQDNDLYPFYAWMERHLQRMKYAGRYGLAPGTKPSARPWKQRWPNRMYPRWPDSRCPPITPHLMCISTQAA